MSVIPPDGETAPPAKQMQFVVAHASLKSAQATSMLAPPIYLAISLIRRRGFSIGRVMRVTTGSVAVGAGIGVGMGYMRLRNEPDVALSDRVFRLVSPPPIRWWVLFPFHSPPPPPPPPPPPHHHPCAESMIIERSLLLLRFVSDLQRIIATLY